MEIEEFDKCMLPKKLQRINKMTEELEQLEEKKNRISFKRAYQMQRFDSKVYLKRLGYSSSEEFRKLYFPDMSRANFVKLCAVGKFLTRRRDGEVFSILAEEKIVNDLNGNPKTVIVDYDLYILAQMAKLSPKKLKELHRTGMINPQMTLAEIKDVMKEIQ